MFLLKKKNFLILLGMFILILISGCTTQETTKEINAGFPIDSEEKQTKFQSEILEVHYLDVGQGDSILIKLPNSQTMLIDAGGNSAADSVLNYLKNQGIKRLDHVIGTHPHEDHIGGLDVVINSLDIGNVYLPKVTHTSKSFEDLLLAIKKKDLKATEAKAGVELKIGEGVTAVFLAPTKSGYESLNDYSAVIKLTYGQTGFLFTGDAEEKSEGEMLQQSRTQLEADVLKVGHHGSVSSTSEPFLDAVSPEFAIISVGKGNDYGHPHQEIIKRLEEKGVQYFRTDFRGTIIAVSNGKEINFQGLVPWQSSSNGEIKKEIKIVSIDVKTEVVTIQNTGDKDINLTGWKLVSIKGNDEFLFPDNFILKAGEVVRIASGPNALERQDTLFWTNKYIWNNDGDPGRLYDELGRLISSWD